MSDVANAARLSNATHVSLLPPHLRQRCESAIERLIAFLDAFETDCDLEPSLGSYMPHVAYDAEADHPGGDADAEPSIGAPETTTCGQQTDSQAFTWGLPAAYSRDEDLEHDYAESGIGDHDGLTEQMMRHHGIVAD